jgi:hypothetical protein
MAEPADLPTGSGKPRLGDLTERPRSPDRPVSMIYTSRKAYLWGAGATSTLVATSSSALPGSYGKMRGRGSGTRPLHGTAVGEPAPCHSTPCRPVPSPRRPTASLTPPSRKGLSASASPTIPGPSCHEPPFEPNSRADSWLCRAGHRRLSSRRTNRKRLDRRAV